MVAPLLWTLVYNMTILQFFNTSRAGVLENVFVLDFFEVYTKTFIPRSNSPIILGTRIGIDPSNDLGMQRFTHFVRIPTKY